MFGGLFGWRKASKCKKVMKKAQCRLNLLKKKRLSIVKHLRDDTANLISSGHHHIALSRAEQLIKDESVAVAYELIDGFCDFVRTHFKYIRKHKECPDDINEAVSSLIYASARCGDLPELREIRELFQHRYGTKLVLAAVELLPGNLVSQQIKEALNTKSVSDNMKQRMVKEIATDYCLQTQSLALDYYPEWQYQAMDVSDRQVMITEIQISVEEGSERRIVPLDPAPVQAMSVSESNSSESPEKFIEEMSVLYLDDIEELQSPREDDSVDRRGFKFKASILTRSSVDRNKDSWSEKSSSESTRRSSIVSRKRTRRRSGSREKRGLGDIEFPSYYVLPHKPRSKQSRKIRKDDTDISFCSGESRVTSLSRNRRVYPPTPSDFSSETNADMSDKPSRRSLERGKDEFKMSLESSEENDEGDFLNRFARNVSMPLERSKERCKDEFQRSNSCPVQNPKHVHPKLPDYDDLTARFMALKKESVVSKLHCCNAQV